MLCSGIVHVVCHPLLVLLAGWVLLSGCATTQFVEIREKPRNPLAERLETSRIGQLQPSHRTERFLKQTSYQGSESLSSMLRHALAESAGLYPLEAKHALAELNYLGAQAMSGRDAYLTSELYLDSAHWAWEYFATELPGSEQPKPTAPEHRGTAEVYNASCESLLRMARKRGRYLLGQSLRMPLSGRQLVFEIPQETRMVNRDTLGDFEFVSDFRLTNLRNHHTASGLGVPIVAIRRPSAVPHPIEDYYTSGLSFASTLVLKFPERSTADPTGRERSVRLQAHDPRENDGFLHGHSMLPLESDLSTPLARFLSNPDLKLLDTWGFLRPDRANSVAGLYMVQPFDPDRIPVLMVHGMWSSPMTWMEMFNDLQADPEIRRRYQFWFYLYPTGEPLPFAAANLRDELKKVRDDCDPERTNIRLDQMVIVGHSMGGLISHMLTIDSEDRLWNSVSPRRLDEIPAEQAEKNEIKRVFFFTSNPSVTRIVTIATPYDGSNWSNRFTRWLGGAFIWLPSRTLQLTRLVFEQTPGKWWDGVVPQRTSVDSMAQKSAVLTLIRETRMPTDVRHHNIVSVSRGRSVSDWSDGVVGYLSAHRPEAESEVVVRAGHSEVQRHPVTIDEVRRVLIVHLNESQRRGIPVIPVRNSQGPPSDPHPSLSVLAP